MPKEPTPIELASFATFGQLLRFLRTRARLTQRELSIAVGYSEAQISRLESTHRPPDLAAVAALFVPALDLRDDPEAVARLLELAAQARGTAPPAHLTITRTVKREVRTQLGEPPLAAALPLARTSLFGREREAEQLLAVVSEARLVTLTGAGGSGKTRLALHVAAQAARSFPEGVCFVGLAALADPALVPAAAATALNLPAYAGATTEAVASALGAKRALLVLDNCEHVVGAASRFAEALLSACPSLGLLATSREPLETPGERVVRVQPLGLPEPGVQAPQVIAASAAVQLFVARAQAALPGFTLHAGNAQAVAQICRRLDGMPLAIELAAARMSLLSIGQIAQRLDDRFLLLSTSRQAEPRHQSLRLALDWSHDLLSADERALFARLAVFAGGWSIEALEQIGGDAPGQPSLDRLEQLIAKSLVTIERRGELPARFGMLETVREYAREKLDASGEANALRERHLRYYVGFFEQAAPRLHGPEQLAWLAVFEAEQDNTRAALAYACQRADAAAIEQGYRLALAISHAWFVRGQSDEAGDWLQRLLALADQPARSAARGRAVALAVHWLPPEQWQATVDASVALCRAAEDRAGEAFARLHQGLLGWVGADLAASHAAFAEALALSRAAGDAALTVSVLAELAEFEQVRRDDRPAARRHFAESLARARELGDARAIAIALAHLGDLALEQGQVPEAQSACAEALSISAELGDFEGMSWSLNGLSIAALGLGDAAQAMQLGEESLRLSREWSSSFHKAIRAYWLARAVLMAGDAAQAQQLHEDNLAHCRRVQFDWGEAVSLQELGSLALVRGDLAGAWALQREALGLLRAGSYGYSTAYSLDAFAAIHAAEGLWRGAALLLGAADALRERIHTALLPSEQRAREAQIAAIGAALGVADFVAARDQGATLAPDHPQVLGLC